MAKKTAVKRALKGEHMHEMEGGHMMKDSEMKSMMAKRKMAKKKMMME